jgi:hypothetical protein
MKLSAVERKLLHTFSSLAAKLTGSGSKVANKTPARGRRAFRTREESAQIQKDMLAAVKKGRPVAEIASEFGVTSPYVYQLMTKAGIRRRKSK